MADGEARSVPDDVPCVREARSVPEVACAGDVRSAADGAARAARVREARSVHAAACGAGDDAEAEAAAFRHDDP